MCDCVRLRDSAGRSPIKGDSSYLVPVTSLYAWEPPASADSRRLLHKGRARQTKGWYTAARIPAHLQGSGSLLRVAGTADSALLTLPWGAARAWVSSPLPFPESWALPCITHPELEREGEAQGLPERRPPGSTCTQSWREVSCPNTPTLEHLCLPRTRHHPPHRSPRAPTGVFLLGGSCLAGGQSSRPRPPRR